MMVAVFGICLLLFSVSPALAAESQAMECIQRVDKEVGALQSTYPHLSLWDTQVADEPRSCEGKRFLFEGRRVLYAHAVPADDCRTEPTTFDNATCHIDIIVYTREECDLLAGPSAATKVFQMKMGDHCIVADIWTNNPESPELEQEVVSLVKTAAESVALKLSNQKEVPDGE